MQSYIGCKIIQAEAMDEFTFLSEEQGMGKDGENRSGYRVCYPDGYISWSPKEVFENVYRRITSEERQLIQNSPA